MNNERAIKILNDLAYSISSNYLDTEDVFDQNAGDVAWALRLAADDLRNHEITLKNLSDICDGLASNMGSQASLSVSDSFIRGYVSGATTVKGFIDGVRKVEDKI